MSGLLHAFARDGLGGPLALCLAAAVGWASYLVARRALPAEAGAPASVRWAATALCALGWLAALFWVTWPLGLFRLVVLLPGTAALALAAHRLLDGSGGRGALARDLAAARGRLGSLAREPGGWMLGATLLVGLVRTLRGSVAPPLGWDSLTYHLFRAGRWVQTGGLARHAAPDAWGNYEYFPVVGDLYWAWAMLPFRGDLPLAAAGAGIWAVVLLATYACARTLGAGASRAAMAAAAVGAMPSVLAYLSSAYVDNTTLALFLLGSLFLARFGLERRLAEAPLAVAAFALMVGVKLTTAALFALAAVAVVVLVMRAPAPAKARRLALLACLLVALVGTPSYLRAWIERGSPFFPFPISFGGVVLSEGSEDSGRVAALYLGDERYHLDGPGEFWAYFLSRPTSRGYFVNPGPGILIFGLLALLALPELVREGRDRRDRRSRRRLGVALGFLAAALVMIAGFLSGNMELFRRTLKVATAGRYLTPGFAALAVVAARRSGPAAPWAWATAVAVGLWLSRPVAWAPSEPRAVGLAALAVTLAAALVGLALRARRRRWLSPALAGAGAVCVLAVACGAVGALRAEHRHELWRAAADPEVRTFHMHPLHGAYAAAWPIWEALDDPVGPVGHRVAVTAGWDGVGHNWYQYPLLGSRLRNRVLYVPITGDGSIPDYREPEAAARAADLPAWLARLVEARVGFVVSLAPRSTPEDAWMRRLPGIFEPRIEVGDLHALYRFDREAAVSALAEVRRRLEAERTAQPVPQPPPVP